VNAQIAEYSSWSSCAPTASGQCQQNRTVTSCYNNAAAPFCVYPYTTAQTLGILDCQSCLGGSCPATVTAIPTNWQGTYVVDETRCNKDIVITSGPLAGLGAAIASKSAQCCCMTGKVNVRQYDELVEMTFPEGVTLEGSGCYIAAAAGTPLTGTFIYPQGISFKTVDPLNPANAATYVNGVPFKDPVTGATITPVAGSTVGAPDSIRSAGQVTIFGRSYRVILTCGNIYIFGVSGFSSTDNVFCPQKLNFVAPLASF